jgi:predicted DNA-binding transcriptional regulator AlpA
MLITKGANMRTQTPLSRAVSGSPADSNTPSPPNKRRGPFQNHFAGSAPTFSPDKKSAGLVSEFLIADPHRLSVATGRAASDPASNTTRSEVEGAIRELAKKAQESLTSPLVRLPALCDAFGLARSTTLKKVARKELPQRVHFQNSRVSAFRKVDIDMTLAASALAARYGYVLNSAAFIAAISAPLNSTALTN